MTSKTGIPSQTDKRELLRQALEALEKMQRKLEASERSRHEPIAIIGLGCRLPGGIRTPEQYWKLLTKGRDAISRMPENRWKTMIGPEGRGDDRTDTQAPWGGFLADIDMFDAGFFGISRREAESMDPQQRLLLEVCWEALEHAGINASTLRGSKTGVFVGVTTMDYSHIALNQAPSLLDAYTATGTALNVTAGRVAYTLGLNGPSMAVDTACSSSLVAIHLASQSLRLGEAEMALAGGVNALLKPEPFICFIKWGMMAPDGRCKTFDVAADGFVRSEGCGILVLKRLSDALAAEDNILAVIKGSAVNQDGASSGLTVPNGRAQVNVIKDAMEFAGLKAEDIGYIEAHGTGTRLGDPIELEALTQVLGNGRTDKNPLIVGSVKTNLGHLESASGVAGIIKVILALQNRTIPAHLHFKRINPQIRLDNTPVLIPTTNLAWDEHRVAGVSSFGFSGTNAHMILEAAPKSDQDAADDTRPLHLLAISAKTPEALIEMARRYSIHLDQAHESVSNFCFSANVGRTHFKHRLALTGISKSDFSRQLISWGADSGEEKHIQGLAASGQGAGVVFLFTGQGAQYVGMGRELYRTQKIFRNTIDECDAFFKAFSGRSLIHLLYPEGSNGDKEEHLLQQTSIAQPALFAIEYALAELWRYWGIEPSATMGHSVGEYVAACVAGLFSLEDGIKLIAERGRLMQSLPAGGKMAAIFTDGQSVEKALSQHTQTLSIAAYNGPENTVISGKGEDVQAVVGMFKAQGIGSLPLKVSHAFHSPLMDPILDEFEHAIEQVTFQGLRTMFVSNLTGETCETALISNAAWWRNHIRQPVRFSDSIESLYKQGFRVFLEIGPHPTLSAMAKRCLPHGAVQWHASLRRGGNDWQQMLENLGSLYVNGARIDWQGFHRDQIRGKVPIPTYPFQHKHYWIKQTMNPSPQSIYNRILHPLLHRKYQSPVIDATIFETVLDLNLLPYLEEHRVFGKIVVPATAYLEMGHAAASLFFGETQCCILDFNILQPLAVEPGGKVTVQTIITSSSGVDSAFQIYSREDFSEGGGTEWRLHANGRIQLDKIEESSYKIEEVMQQGLNPRNTGVFYDKLARQGIEYGESFKGLMATYRLGHEAIGKLRTPVKLGHEVVDYNVHPAILDTCIQILGAEFLAEESEIGNAGDIYLPMGLEKYRVFLPGEEASWCVGHIRKGVDQEVIYGDVHILTSDSRLLAEVRGMRFKRADEKALQRMDSPLANDWLYRLEWRPLERIVGEKESSQNAGHWLIFTEENGIGSFLAEKCRNFGATAHLVYPGEGYEEIDHCQSTVNPSSSDDLHRLLERATSADNKSLQGVIHLWSSGNQISGETKHKIEESAGLGWPSILNLVQALPIRVDNEHLNLTIVTSGALSADGTQQITDPFQAMLWGLGRVIASEHPELNCKMIDFDSGPYREEHLEALFFEIIIGERNEHQVLLRQGKRFGLRLVRAARELGKTGMLNSSALEQPYQLKVTQQGILEGLELQSQTVEPPQKDEIQIEIEASGLNFRDVLNVLGMYPGDPGPLGNECAGRVSDVGEDVDQIRIGDIVMAITPQAFCSYVNTKAELAYRIPTTISVEESATIPMTFLTAHYALNIVGKMQRGEKVLIHAAAGGVGMAAVQLARITGAEIFATAGSSEKRELLRSMGVAHVMNSRNLDFADQIMEVTQGGGIDIVLNSLAGEFIPKSISILKKGGRFLEIGKIDLLDQQQVSHLYPDITYAPLLLGDVCQKEPNLIQTMFENLVQAFTSGMLQPLPRKVYPIHDSSAAFRYMAQARHVGKIVIDHNPVIDKPIRSDASYIITGGLGGLGLRFADWLVEKGARRLLLVSRKEADERKMERIREMEKTGAEVSVIRCNVADDSDLQKCFALYDTMTEMPIRGIVHAAGVIDDGILQKQTVENFSKVLAPKVKGSWNLHRLTEKKDLDFFVLFSSASSVFGMPGQGNYATANAFMDALSGYRCALNLPAISINWGPWSEIGMASKTNDGNKKRWENLGVGQIKPDEGLIALELAMDMDIDQLIVLPINWSLMLRERPEIAKQPFVKEIVGQLGQLTSRDIARSSDGILAQLKMADPADQYEMLSEHLRFQILTVLGLKPSDHFAANEGFADLGMDSLMSVELSNRLQKSFKKNFPSTLAFEYPSLTAITDYLARDVLKLQYGDGVLEDTQAPSGVEKSILSDVSDMSDSEVEENLLKELDSTGY